MGVPTLQKNAGGGTDLDRKYLRHRKFRGACGSPSWRGNSDFSGLRARWHNRRDFLVGMKLSTCGITRKGMRVDSVLVGVVTLMIPVLAPVGTLAVISEADTTVNA